MLIRMRITARGVEDGFTCREYRAGETHNIAHALACYFINRGYADQLAPEFEENTMTHSPPRLLARIVAPAAEPLTLAETKLYLHVDSAEEDDLISGLIVAARISAEEYLNRSLITQQWKLGYNDAPPECVPLPRGPVISVGSVNIIARDGGATAVSASTYYLNAAKDTLEFDSTPLGHRVEITYTAGYGAAASDVPDAIRKGLLAHIAMLYDFRGEGEEMIPAQSIALYAPFREVRV